jgi:hypothetical protein
MILNQINSSDNSRCNLLAIKSIGRNMVLILLLAGVVACENVRTEVSLSAATALPESPDVSVSSISPDKRFANTVAPSDQSLPDQVRDLQKELLEAQEHLGFRPNIDQLRKYLENTVTQCGLRLLTFQPLPERNFVFYGEIKINLHVVGGFWELAYLFETVAREYRISNVSDLRVRGIHKTGGPSIAAEFSLAYFWNTDRIGTGIDLSEVSIDELNQYKKTWSYRIDTINSLIGKRSSAVALLNELLIRAHEEIWFREIRQADESIFIRGVCLSQSRIEDFVESLKSSPLITNPALIVLQNRVIEGRSVGEFELEFNFKGNAVKLDPDALHISIPQGTRRRDPFILFEDQQTSELSENSVETMEISEVTLLGIQIGIGKFAIVKGVDQKICKLEEGQQLKDGKVIAIESGKVVFERIVKDAFGRQIDVEIIEHTLSRSGATR